MAELSAFEYRPGGSRLHRMDPRFKLLCLLFLGLALMQAGPAVLAGVTALLLIQARLAGLSLVAAAMELRLFFFLLIGVLTARAVSTPGEALVAFWGVTLTREGVAAGGLICGRLAAVTLAGLLMTATTSGSRVRAGIGALLRPLPKIPHQRVATALGLLLRFIPMILTLAAETSDAQKARAVENRKNPVYRIPRFALPLLRRSFQRADRLALAMGARGYSEQRTQPVFRTGAGDRIALAVCLAILALSFLER